MIPIVALVNGEARVVQAENSHFKLHVPKGVHGAILANTNHARFIHHVPDGDCFMSQICDYHLQPPYSEQSLSEKYKIDIPPPPPEDIKYQIQMPYIIKDVEIACPNTSVQQGNFHVNVSQLENPSPKTRDENIDEELITDHLGRSIVGQKANVHLFAALRNIPDATPHATVKVYFSSIHSDLKNDISVRVCFKSKHRSCHLKNIMVTQMSATNCVNKICIINHLCL